MYISGMEQTFYCVSMIFNKSLINGEINTHNCVRCLWARNEKEAFGMAYEDKPNSVNSHSLFMKVVVPTDFKRHIKEELEIKSPNVAGNP